MQMNKSPNQPNRSISPARNSNSKQKYYSAQDVNKIVRNTFEPKIQFLIQELEQRESTIMKLNNKLNQNDQKLLQQANTIQAFSKKQKQLPHLQSFVSNTVKQILNEKLKQIWENISQKIGQISNKAQSKYDSQRLQNMVQTQMEKMKLAVNQFMEYSKSKSNTYWQKIKDALNKIHAKITKNQQDIADLNLKIQKFQQDRSKDRETVVELQNSKNVVRNLVELKRSVGSMYQSYQIIINLQRQIKQKIEEQEDQDSIWHQPNFFSIKQQQEQTPLEYSKDPITNQNKFQQQDFLKVSNKPAVSPIKSQTDKTVNDFVRMGTSPLKKSNQFSEIFSIDTSQNQYQSRFHNNTLLINMSMQTRKQMCHEIRERLIALIQSKKWEKPLKVKFDQQINYLKSAQGNYLFDLKGNMFKTNLKELIKLEEEGLIVKTKNQLTSIPKTDLLDMKND